MPSEDSKKGALAREVEERWIDLDMEPSDNRLKYPIAKFQAFAQAVRGYIKYTARDELVHRKVVNILHDLTESLTVNRKRIPQEVLLEAERLECLMFAGYDPYFEGDEPPRL